MEKTYYHQLHTYFLLLLSFYTLKLCCGTPLPSSFYQPGPGVILDRWLSSTAYSLDDFHRIPNYPGCPTYVSNSDTFEYDTIYTGQNQHGRFRAFFIPTQTGKHKFFAILNNKARIYIEMNPAGLKKILDINYSTSDDWNQRKWCDEVTLVKGFRYEITVYHYGNGYNPDFFRLGVKFPDNTEVKPIPKAYLRRSIEYYKWDGLIAQKYEGFTFSYYWTSVAQAYSSNPKYPNTPSSFTCKSSLFDPEQYQDFGNCYALRYIGYMKLPADGTYKFKMWCNEICEFFVSKTSGVETSLGTSIKKKNPGGVEMDGGALSKNKLYPIKAFMAEGYGSDYIRIQYQMNGGGYVSSWDGMLQNLETVETMKNIPLPIPTMVSSTAISIQLPSTPFLPPKDQWTYIQNHEVLYHENGVEEPLMKITVTDALPKTVVATGLKKYTDYVFYARYYGKINGEDQNIITGYSVIVKSDEDVPEIAPSSITATEQSSTSIKVTWGTITPFTNWNGIQVGYEVQYRLKNSLPGNWTSALTTGSGRQYFAIGLLKYKVYEFKVAGRTIKGSGPFTAIVEKRTMEDVPSAAPTNIIAQNTNSSSIRVTWDDVPEQHQNGIITGYKVYMKKVGFDGEWTVEDVSGKTFSKSGLDLWTFYDVKVSAKTSKGEGIESGDVRARTDEDVPGAAPLSIAAVALSSTSINVTWANIIEAQTYGIILSYKVKCRRADGKDSEKQLIVDTRHATLAGLAAYEEYDIYVAGMTVKGVGVYSSKVSVRTLQSPPDAPPTNLRGNYTNSTAIRVHWDQVPEENQNGVIRRYSVQYRIKGSESEFEDVVVDAEFMTVHVANLEYYTIYEFKVAAETNAGRGPYSNIVEIRTDADAPSRPPMNLTGHFLDHRSIQMNWTRVPKDFRHGTIFGYKLHYRDATIADGAWHIITIPNRDGGSDMFKQNITGLKIYTPYKFKIQAFTYKADGVFSENVTVWTDEYDPEEPPRNISGFNASSTELVLRWEDMKEIDGDANGKVLGYVIKYRVIDCHEDRPAGCDENQYFNITSNGSLSEIKIPGLRKYTSYSLSVQVFNSKGKGNFSKTIEITTDEDIPDEPPTIIETWPAKTDAIDVYWSPIPESHRNGIILGYRIFYKAINEPQRHYNRAPRSVNQYAMYGGLPGEKMVEVNSTTYQVEIQELKDYSWYQVRVGAFTSKGLGTTFTINGTTRQGSPIEAPEFQIVDWYGFDEMLLKWNPISEVGAKGEVLGYRIQYWLTELHDSPIPLKTKSQLEILEPNRTTVIKGLQPFAKYRVQISAFTEGGFGVWSEAKDGETCRCSKTFSSAKIILPPLVQSNNLQILPALLDEAVTSCCGNCSGRHGITRVNWDRDSNNVTSMKYSKKEALEAIAAGTNLALPIFRDSWEIEGDVNKSEYVWVPLVESYRIAIFKRNPSDKVLGNSASSIMMDSIWEQYPLLLVSFLLTVLAAICFWILERGDNTAEFSSSFFKGSASGLWLAYVTMTTVGYGDLTPITKMGKMHAMVWMLIGLVLTSMIVGNISSILSIDFVFKPVTLYSSNEVLVSNEMLMLAKRLYGTKVRPGNTSDGKYIQQALISGNASKVVLDIYTASSLKDYLIHPEIMLEKTEEFENAYGVALAGESKRIKKCIRSYSNERSATVLEKIKKEIYIYKVGTAKSTDLIAHMFSTESDILINCKLYGGVILAVLVVIGTIYEIFRCFRERSRVETDATISMQMSTDILRDIEVLQESIVSKLNSLERNHMKEKLTLDKMQYGKYAKLVSMYPTLHLFDPAMPKSKKYEEELNENFAKTESLQYYHPSDDDEDKPIDYKTDSAF